MVNPEQPVLAQKYRLIGQLQAGGMGSVWVAEHIHLNSLVAVKLMGREVAATAAGTERFLLEARAAAALRSPHVVQILDYGVHEGTPFIAMELLEGESLGSRLQREGRFQSWEQAELVLRQIARAVAKAHDAGIVHRDLKPSNIFLVRNEEEEIVKLLDFGIAKTTSAKLNASPGNHTRTGEFLGSPVYSSPEQLQASKLLDHRADIWSLGVLAFECLIGRPPFASDTLAGLVLAICMSPLPVPSEHGPVPRGFDAWFARACARDVSARFQTVREASSELRRLIAAASGGRVSTPELAESAADGTERAAAPPDSAPGVQSPPSSSPTDPTVRQRRRLLPEGGVDLSLTQSEAEPLVPVTPSPVAPFPEALLPPPAPLPWQLAAQRAEATRAGLGDAMGSPRRRRRMAPLLAGLSLLVAVPSLLAWRALASRSSFDSHVLGLGASRVESVASSASEAVPEVPEATAGEAPSAEAASPEAPQEVAAAAPPEVVASGVVASEVAAPEPAAPAAAEASELSPAAELREDPATTGAPAAALPTEPGAQPDKTTSLAAAPEPASPEPATPAASAVRPKPTPARSPRPPKQPSAPPTTAPASLASPPEGAPEAPRPRARAPRSTQARLTITASSTASVFLDGIPIGTTPIADVAVPAGEHEVTFVHDGERSTERVTLRAGEHKRVAFRPAPGDGLDEAAVQRTMRRHGETVREECWEAALRNRGGGDPGSARVTATITVEPSGRVRSVSTTGAPEAYPELPYCIEDEVRTWVFPSAPAETIVTVPFVFVTE